MASATINLNKSVSSGNYIIGKIEWSSTADNNSNTSGVTAKLYVRKYNDSVTLTVPTSGKWSYSLTVNGSEISGSIRKDVLTDWVLLATKSITVDHNNDGTKSITISGSVTAPTGTSLEGHKTSGSGTAKMDTVPRATTIEKLECTTAYLDGTITAKYTPQNASYYNRRVIYLNRSGALTEIRRADLGQKSASQQTSTMNLSEAELQAIYTRLKETVNATIRVSFQTFSDSGYTVRIGNDHYLEISLKIPEDVKPTVELTVSPTTNFTWIAQKGIYATGLTGAAITTKVEPGDGATIKSTSIVAGNTTYNQSSLNISSFVSAGEYTITAKVVDSRGRSGSDTKKINVRSYSAPAFSTFVVERGTYDAGWTAAENGPDVRVVFNVLLGLTAYGNVYNAAFKIDGSTKAPDYGNTSDLPSGENRAVYFFDVDAESTHTLDVTITDSVGQSTPIKATIPTINVTVEYNVSGKGIAFGKTSEKDAFECAWPAYFSGYAYTKGLRIPLVQWGTVSITPSAADTPTSKVVTFGTEFPGNPSVTLTPQTSVPGTTVLGVGVSDRSAAGVTVWVSRINTTATVVQWLAVY